MSGQAAPDTDANLAEGDVDLVVHDKHALEWDPECAACRADRAAGVVHVRLRKQQRHARAPRSGAALGEQPGVLGLERGQTPAVGVLLSDREADVVSRVRVLAAGVSQPDDQPVDCSAAARPPPAAPWTMRAKISVPRSGAMPQASEARVKRATEIM